MNLDRWFGIGSRIDKTIDGTRYTLAVRLFAGGSTQAAGNALPPDPSPIVTATIERVTDLGSGRWELVFERAPQRFFFVIPPERIGQGATAVPYNCTMGGNVAEPAEWQRGWSPFGAPIRGSMQATRAREGDGGCIVRGPIRSMPGMLESVLAHSAEPTSVNYVAPSVPRPVYQSVELARGLVANRNGTVVSWQNRSGADVAEGDVVEITNGVFGTALEDIDVSETGDVAADITDGEIIFDGLLEWPLPSGLVIWDDSTPTNATRVIFAPEGGDPDEAYLPPDLGASGFDSTAYWWDTVSTLPRLSSFCFLDGDEAELFWWVATGETLLGTPSGQGNLVALLPTEGAGYSADFDNLLASSWYEREDFDRVVWVYNGEGGFEWREASAVASRMVAVRWNATGPLDAWERLALDGTATNEALDDDPTFASPWQLRLRKVDDIFTFFARQDGTDSWVEIFETTLSGVLFETGGFVGPTAWDETPNASSVDGSGDLDRYLMQLGTGGRHALYRTTGRLPFLASVDSGLPVAGLQSVVNLMTGETLAEGSGVRRDQYRSIDGNIHWVLEQSGDAMLATYAAPPPETPPGRAPRPVPGQVERGWVETDPETGLPTSNKANNRANWHDSAIWICEDGTVPMVGDAFEVTRWGAFDPTDPPSIFFDLRNSGEEDWQPITAGVDFLPAWFAGVLLFSEAWVAANISAGSTACFRALGKPFLTDIQREATRCTEFREAVEGLEELYVQIPVQGPGRAIYGTAAQQAPAIYTSDGEGGWEFVAYVLGMPDAAYQKIDLTNIPVPWGTIQSTPYWFYDASISSLYFVDSIKRAGYTYDPAALPSGASGSWILSGPGEGDGEVYVLPFTTGPFDPVPNRAGAEVPPRTYETGFEFTASSVFSFNETPFTLASVLACLPDSAEILEATIEARFTELESCSWSAEYEFDGEFITYRCTYNGTLVGEYVEAEDINYIDTEAPMFVPGGPVSLALVARRRKTENIVAREATAPRLDYLYAAPSDEYLSFGGGALETPAEGAPGEYAIADVTSAVQAVLAARGSLAGFDTFAFWPTWAPPPSSDAPSLAAFARALLPAGSVGGTETTFGWSGSGVFLRWDSLSLGTLLVRYRLGLGPDQLRAVPLNWPRAI